MLFKKLPVVKTCCCCVPLKWGTVYLASYYILSSIFYIVSVSSIEQHSCYSSGATNVKCSFKPVWDRLKYFLLATLYMVIIMSILLIVAVFRKNRMIITIFLYVFTVHIVLDTLLVVFVLIILPATRFECQIKKKDHVLCMVTVTMNFTLCIYFVIIVNSYRFIIDEDTYRLAMPRQPSVLIRTKSIDRIRKNARFVEEKERDGGGSSQEPQEQGTKEEGISEDSKNIKE